MNGKVMRVLADKKFGFIKGDDGNDYFFHMSDLNGFFDDLVADNRVGHTINVTFEPSTGKKGLRANEVVRTDGGVA